MKKLLERFICLSRKLLSNSDPTKKERISEDWTLAQVSFEWVEVEVEVEEAEFVWMDSSQNSDKINVSVAATCSRKTKQLIRMTQAGTPRQPARKRTAPKIRMLALLVNIAMLIVAIMVLVA